MRPDGGMVGRTLGRAPFLASGHPSRLEGGDNSPVGRIRPMHEAQEDDGELLGWRDAARHLFYLVLACVGARSVLWLIFLGFFSGSDTPS